MTAHKEAELCVDYVLLLPPLLVNIIYETAKKKKNTIDAGIACYETFYIVVRYTHENKKTTKKKPIYVQQMERLFTYWNSVDDEMKTNALNGRMTIFCGIRCI